MDATQGSAFSIPCGSEESLTYSTTGPMLGAGSSSEASTIFELPTFEHLAEPLSTAAAQLFDEVDRLALQHQSALRRCVDGWLQRQQVAQPRVAPPPSPCVWCEQPSAVPEEEEEEAEEQALKEPHPLAVVPAQPAPPHPVLLRPWMQMMVKGDRGGGSNNKVTAVGGRRRKRGGKGRQELLPRTASTTSEVTPLQRLTSSRYYEWLSGILIFLNAIFIGWQTQFTAERAESDAALGRPLQSHTPTGFLALQVVFSVLFSFELGFRWVCEGFVYFIVHGDRWWNLLDVVIVTASWIDLFIQFVIGQDTEDGGNSLGNLSMLRVVRVVRVVRIARVIRIMRFFRELRMMVYSILGCLKYLLWVIVVLTLVFYVFGITFTAAAIAHLETTDLWLSSDTKELRSHFGTVDRSVLSLFMAMSGGNDWGLYYDALHVLPWQYKLLFLLFITFAVFAVVNIVTGVFVESAMQSNFMDRDIVVHEELEAKKAYLSSMREVFEEMDLDSTGCISLEEFERRLDDERVIAYFNALKLDVSDARTVFRLLDYDQSDEVNIEEFLSGCYRLQGESRSLDMKIMQCEVRFLQESFLVFGNTLNEVHAYLKEREHVPDVRCRTKDAVMKHVSSGKRRGTA